MGELPTATIVVCPNCGHHFDRPFLAEKKTGLGFTFGPMGNVKCPSCSYKASWGAFKKEKDLPPDFAPREPSKENSPSSTVGEEKERALDETKYEQP